MHGEKKPAANDATSVTATQPTAGGYEPPQVVKGRKLADVTGQAAAAPSGAPLPPA